MRYLLAAALLAAPSISNAEVYQSIDKFSGEVTYNTKSRGAHLEGGSFVSMRYVNFQLVVNKSLEKTEKPICIIVMTQTEGWTFIQAGPSMILKLGETEFLTLSGPGSGSGRTAIGGDTVTEVAGWCTSIETAEKMAASKVLQFRILGDQRTLTGSLGANFLSDLTEITNFVKADLGSVDKLRLHIELGLDGVVPFAVEVVAMEIECVDLFVGDLDALGVRVGVEFAAD
jgi:hypothetical protein